MTCWFHPYWDEYEQLVEQDSVNALNLEAPHQSFIFLWQFCDHWESGKCSYSIRRFWRRNKWLESLASGTALFPTFDFISFTVVSFYGLLGEGGAGSNVSTQKGAMQKYHLQLLSTPGCLPWLEGRCAATPPPPLTCSLHSNVESRKEMLLLLCTVGSRNKQEQSNGILWVASTQGMYCAPNPRMGWAEGWFCMWVHTHFMQSPRSRGI